MCKHGTCVTVETPIWLWKERQNPLNGISIDSCIVEKLVNAWNNGVRTLGSCCGHGKEAPNVVLTNDVEQIELARKFLPDWTLLQWQLVDVTKGVE